MLSGLLDVALLDSVMRALIPILLAALGGMICERAGVFQISLEGLMLIGAFAAVAGSFAVGSALVGVLTAAVAGALVSLVLAYGTVTRGGDAIVLGVAINLLALGLTSFLIAQLFGVRGVFQDPGIVGLQRFAIPVLSDLPIVGSALFRLTPIATLALLLVPVLWVWLFRSASGTRLRGVGERPEAAATLGVNPVRTKYLAVAASGVLAGLAGAQLSLGNVVQFSENMSSGRGWIAVVAVLLGRAHPVGVLGACLLFGVAEGIGFRLQGQGLPSQITDALPFVVTLIALAVARRRFKRVLELTAA
ncbi:MAG: ABC transporter permease [Nitriliruptoraceae bacterium]|nr:ABC transporter permease [Nitriliruptoraceae bacterium]